MFDEEAANVLLPYDEPTSPVPITDEILADADGPDAPSTTNGEGQPSLGDLRDRLAPPKKVYRAEDSAVVKGNLGRLKGISQGLDDEPTEDDMDFDVGYRQNALLLQGEPIAHLPTDQVFAYVTSYATVPAALEWVDDTTCVVVFSSPLLARAARRFLLVNGPEEGDPMPDPLELLPAREVPEGVWPEKARAEGEGAEDVRAALRGQVWVRHALPTDVKQRAARERSQFYSRYGTQAGKEGYGQRKRRREEEDEVVGVEKRRALDDELDAYLQDDPSERERRKKEEMDAQLDAYLAGDEPPQNGHTNGDYEERRMPRPRRERREREPLSKEERAARRQKALDAQLEAYNEADDTDTLRSKMRSDWPEDEREREFSPDRRPEGRRRRGEGRYEDAPVLRPMRGTEKWERNVRLLDEAEEDEGGSRRRARGRGGRRRRNGDPAAAPREAGAGGGGGGGGGGGRRSNARPRKNQDELDAELEAYLNGGA